MFHHCIRLLPPLGSSILFFFLLLINTDTYAGSCMWENADFKACIEKPSQCKNEGYYDDINPHMQFPKWFDAIPKDMRFPLNKFINATSCYPFSLWNLGHGLHDLFYKAEIHTRLRYDQKIRSFLERYFVPKIQQYPVLLQDRTVRYYLLAMQHPLAKQINALSISERSIYGDASVLKELEANLNGGPLGEYSAKCESLYLLFLVDPQMAIQLTGKRRLDCYNTPQKTVALMERVLNKMYTWGYTKR